MSSEPGDSPDVPEAFPPGWSPVQSPIGSRPPRDDRAKWIVGLVVLLVVVVLGAVLLVKSQGSQSAASSSDDTSRGGSAGPARTSPSAPTTVVSANDNEPVALITDDVTCGMWDNVQTAVKVARNAGWPQRNRWIPASAWDADQRARLAALGDALRTGATASVQLAAQTPHRAMRELYGAFIAYGRAYADALPTYQPGDDFLGQASLAALDAITYICAADRSKVADVQAAGLSPVAPPAAPAPVGDPVNPQRFLPQANPMCARWVQDAAALEERSQAWSALDPNIGVGQLNREQVLVYDGMAQLVTAQADTMAAASLGSGNAVVEDFGALGALYFRAYADAVPLIWVGDHDLAEVGFSVNALVSAACQATAG